MSLFCFLKTTQVFPGNTWANGKCQSETHFGPYGYKADSLPHNYGHHQ